MTETGDNSRRRGWWKYLLSAVLVLCLLLLAVVGYTTTNSFQNMVRRRLVSELERATGGRVELGSFHAVPLQFRVDVRQITIHGLEKPGEVPYAHVDRLVAGVKIISALGFEFGFNQLVLEHPVVHIIINPDGSTNQPEPKLKRASENTPIEDLFSLSIGRLEVRRGELLLNDQKIPIAFVANDVSADMTYSVLHRRYESELLLGKVDTRLGGYRPFSWTAEAHFSLGQNSLDVESLKASSGRSRLVATGRVDDFRAPKIAASYDASLDLGELSAIARSGELERGLLQASGRGNWSVQEFSSDGKLQISGLDGHNGSLTLRNVSAEAQYLINSKRLTLPHFEAQLLGGTLTGDADVKNWLATIQSATTSRQSKTEPQTGLVRLKLGNLSIRELLLALSRSSRSLNRLKFAGSLNGTAETRWVGSPDKSETALALDVVPPVDASRGLLPLTGRLRANYRNASNDLDVSDFAALTQATQIRASGTLSSRAAVKFFATTSDLDEWSPVVTAFGGPQLPIALHGRATFNGTAAGKLSDLTFTGDLQAQDFDVLPSAHTSFLRNSIHWDALQTNLEISPHSLSARHSTLRHEQMLINFDVSAGLHAGQFTGDSEFTARLSMHRADVSQVLALAGYKYPASGAMDLRFHAGGTRADPNGEGRVRLTHAIIRGEPVDQLTADLRLQGGQISFNNVEAIGGRARVTGGGTYAWATRNFHFSLSGDGFDLAQIPVLQRSRVAVEGRMDFSAKGSGTPELPVLNANVRLHSLTLDHEPAGDFTVDAVSQGTNLHLAGSSQFQHSELSLDGNIELREDWPSKLNLHFNHLDVDSLLRTYLKGRVTGHSAVAGDLSLEGPLRDPRKLGGLANINDFFVDVEHIKLRNDGPLRFALNNQILDIDQFRLVGEGTDLTAKGTVQLAGEQQLNVKAQGRLNLNLLESLNPDFTSSGIVTVDMSVAGSVAKPVSSGRIQISNGDIAYIDLPSALSDVNGSMILNQDRLQIESLTAHTGGGLVSFGGYATAYNHQVNFDLSVQGRDVRLRYPPGLSSTADADLRWVGSTSGSNLSGEITVNRVAVTPGFDFAAYLQRINQASALPQTNPLLNRIHLDVHFLTAPDLQMQTAVVRLSGDADLHLRGTAAKPVVIGRADVLEGEIYFNGAKYRLERGDVFFSNPVTTTPVVDLQASTRVSDYDITINLNGPPEKLHIIYRSEPPLPEADIVSLLALGRTQEESARLQQSGQTSLSQETSNAILAEALNATVSNRAQRLFGGSRIKIDPQGTTTETSAVHGPQVTIEQQVANNFTLTYSTNVAQASQQIIQVEYNVTRNMSIVATRDVNGVVSFDVRIRRRKK